MMNPPSFRPQLTIPQWLELPMSVRLRLKELFAIPRSKGTEVVNSVVITDGHTHADLSYLTIEKMQMFLEDDSNDFYALFNATIEVIFDQLQQEQDKKLAEIKHEQKQLDREKVEALVALAEGVGNLAEQASQNVEQAAPKKRMGRPKGTKNKKTSV